jgi:hypothetical protein
MPLAIYHNTRYQTRSKSIELSPDTPRPSTCRLRIPRPSTFGAQTPQPSICQSQTPQLSICRAWTPRISASRARTLRLSTVQQGNELMDHTKTVVQSGEQITLSKPDEPDQEFQQYKLGTIKGCRIDPRKLKISETVLGEGQLGTVRLATYRGMSVACKSKRFNTHQDPYDIQARRELEFAAKLSLCRYINKYLGWVLCPKHWVESAYMGSNDAVRRFYIIQNYVSNGDVRSYLSKRSESDIYIYI